MRLVDASPCKLLVAFTAVLLLSGVTDWVGRAAVADPWSECDENALTGVVECQVASGGADGTPSVIQPVAGGGSSEWPPPGHILITYPTFGVTEEGEACRRDITRAVPAGQAQLAVEMTLWYWTEVSLLPPELRPQGDCPPSTGPELDAREAREAMVTLLTQRLPRPQLYIAPGYGLAGMPAYLESGRGLSLAPAPIEVTLSTGPANATFRGAGTYTVDWGDGTVTGPHEAVGAPWPDGTVTHTYVDSGTYEVRVRDRWAVTFTVEGLPPQTVQLSLDAAPLIFEVRERTAVRTRP